MCLAILICIPTLDADVVYGHIRGKYYPENSDQSSQTFTEYGGMKGLLVKVKDFWSNYTYASGYTDEDGYYELQWNGPNGPYRLVINGTIYFENDYFDTEGGGTYSKTITFSHYGYDELERLEPFYF